MPTLESYEGQTPAWCPGCGNFPILNTLKEALAELEIEPHQLTVVSGIGQAAKLPHYMKCNTFNGLHGRTLPVATGIRLANHEMPVIAVAGDGDCYGEGGNHLLHAIRRNINVKLFVHDNQVYGLTKGQASPTTMEGVVTKTQPFGSLSEALNPMAMAVALDCSFVARGFAGDAEFLKGLMKEALNHKGFALLDILQPCVTFNKINTYRWYSERVYRIGDDHDPFDRIEAFKKSLEWGEKIPTGIIYRNSRPTLEERIPVIEETPLIKQLFSFKEAEKEIRGFY
ncbi:MAG TPA: 2-oxoacid:ferredoxin oxidoreductase subunit beta [Nitrospirae bacterium]|nr:2-oxoacid:ferredoxin oxidoreductase subunit beta [Nitrospirota bacterium]